ncbi:hypothetical protein Lser_V15G18497 [Lactuca serriola]
MGTVIDSHFLALTTIVTFFYQFSFFIVTTLLKFDKVTNFAAVVLSFLVIVWGLRLGVFLLMRILNWGEDRRFDEMRENLGKLAVFWIFQAVWVWTISLLVTIVNASDSNPGFEARDIIGWIMWAVGLTIEATTDQQNLMFLNSPANRGKWCDAGLWGYSRHPNYFGEFEIKALVGEDSGEEQLFATKNCTLKDDGDGELSIYLQRLQIAGGIASMK